MIRVSVTLVLIKYVIFKCLVFCFGFDYLMAISL